MTGDKARYNQIEFIFSTAAVSALFLDGGLKTYLLYAYKQSEQSVERIKPIFASYKVLLKGYLFVLAMAFVCMSLWMPERILDWGGATARALFLSMVGFVAVWYRIADKPSRVFILSIPVYVAAGALIWLLGDISDTGFSIALVVPHLLAVALAAFIGFSVGRGNMCALIVHISAALKYGWPILASVLLTMVVANFGKLYAYNYLSEKEMFNFSFSQRMALIIQLGHLAVSGYMAKHLFVSEQRRFHQKTFAVYLITLLMATIVAYSAAWFAPSLGFISSTQIDTTFTLIIIYTLLWCIGGYLELYLNRVNRNSLVLGSAITAAGVFLAWVMFTRYPMISRIATAMALGAASNVMFLIMSLFIIRRN
ncbi:hypothetical protein [Methylomicrobium sp. Wu6]|uniref:hypothetical protein n=1 Tax=Methylomicrobium sp. Wu6 TaxID=3107928 RepID=UPI002DD68B95|nr:hypothetical protein [Methylomicrobium sp. Wu6]